MSSSLEEIIGAALDRLEKSFNTKRIKVVLDENLPFIAVDPILIETVLINLIENAIKFSPINSCINLSANINGKNILVQIQNEGASLGLEEITKVFEKFYHSTDKTYRGVGLGLTICKNIIELHHGRIWVENRKDEKSGSVFSFTLPLS